MKLIVESWRDFVNAPKIFDMDAGQFWDEIFYTTDEILQTESQVSRKPLRDFQPSEHVVGTDYTERHHWRPGGSNDGIFYERMRRNKEWLKADKKNIERVLRTIFAENWEHLDDRTKDLIRQHVDDYSPIASTTHNLKSKTKALSWGPTRNGNKSDRERWPEWGDKASQEKLIKPQYDHDFRDGPTRKANTSDPRTGIRRVGVTFDEIKKHLEKLDPLGLSMPDDGDNFGLSLPEPDRADSVSIPEDYPKDTQSARRAHKSSPLRSVDDISTKRAMKVVRKVATDSSFIKLVEKIPVLSKFLVIGFLVLGAEDAWAKGGAEGLARFAVRSGMEFILGDILTLNDMAEIIKKTSRKESSKMIDQSPIPSSPGRFYNK